MTGNTYGKGFKIMTFGESHGKAMGVVVDGVKPGLKINTKDIQKELNRRRPGRKLTSPRKEPDKVEILSGIYKGKTTGAPICLVVFNKDIKSGDYKALKDTFRPGHAGYTWVKKYGIHDYRGGGRASGRETVSRVAAGAIAKKLLKGIKIISNIIEIHGSKKNFNKIISKARKQGDSVGGIIEIRVRGLKPGIGDPVFNKLDAELAKALMSIGAVKGVEFGDGFNITKLYGSEANDQMNKKGFLSNHSGGILGGVSTGQDLIIRIAVKPTPSISKKQRTINYKGQEVEISIKGRHDPCICKRIMPVAEAMIAIVLCNYLKEC